MEGGSHKNEAKERDEEKEKKWRGRWPLHWQDVLQVAPSAPTVS